MVVQMCMMKSGALVSVTCPFQKTITTVNLQEPFCLLGTLLRQTLDAGEFPKGTVCPVESFSRIGTTPLIYSPPPVGLRPGPSAGGRGLFTIKPTRRAYVKTCYPTITRRDQHKASGTQLPNTQRWYPNEIVGSSKQQRTTLEFASTRLRPLTRNRFKSLFNQAIFDSRAIYINNGHFDFSQAYGVFIRRVLC